MLGADYLGSMLKMETDDYAEPQPMSGTQQPDLLKMCRSRYEKNNINHGNLSLLIIICQSLFFRKPSLSGSPRTAKRRRTLNNTCSADESDDHDVNEGPGN